MIVYDIHSVNNLLVSNKKEEIKMYYKFSHDPIVRCSSKDENEVCSKQNFISCSIDIFFYNFALRKYRN